MSAGQTPAAIGDGLKLLQAHLRRQRTKVLAPDRSQITTGSSDWTCTFGGQTVSTLACIICQSTENATAELRYAVRFPVTCFEMAMTASFFKALSRLLLFAFLFVVLCPGVPIRAQSNTPSSQRKTSTPYTGDLSIFESGGRDERLQINRVMDILGIQPGKSVADIGAGSGWFTVRAARRVSQSGTVFAVDINPQAIEYVTERAKKEQLSNIKTILSAPDDAQLPPASVDAVLLLKTYHEIAHPVVLLKDLRSSLRPGAKIGVIDRNGSGEDHGINKEIVIREAGEAGYELRETHDFVKADKMDYFLIFTAKPN